MAYNAWFQCINQQCKATYPLNKIIYRCESCSSLLEVRHDMQALAGLDAKSWMKLFEDRYKSNQWPYGSGVWGKNAPMCPMTISSPCTRGIPISFGRSGWASKSA